MKKGFKLIVPSLLAILVCVLLLAGSTFALFTSDVTKNIVVGSATVNMTAEYTEFKAYSVEADDNGTAGEATAYGVTSKYKYSTEDVETVVANSSYIFANKGTAKLTDENTIELVNVTPGDRITANLKVTNNSNVDIIYRVRLNAISDNGLLDGLTVKAGGETLTGVIKVGEWTPWNVPTELTKVENIALEVFLPVEAGNEYQTKQATLRFTIEAVQANAKTDTLLDQVNAYLAGTSSPSKNNTMYDAIQEVKGNTEFAAFDATKYLWSPDTDQFYAPYTVVAGFESHFFKAYLQAEFNELIEQKYNIYAIGEWTGSINITVGFDAGEATGITSINYDRHDATTAQKVVIRTNGGTLVINDTNPDSEQVHYGTLSSAEVTTGTSCFKTYGAIGTMDLKAGKAIADKGGYVGLIKAAEGTQVAEQNGGVFVIPSNASTSEVDGAVASSLGYTVNENKFVANAEREAKAYYEIYNVETLLAYRDLINSGSQIPVAKVTANIDMSGVDWVEMIGKDANHQFTGKLDGQGYTISNLSNGDRFTTGTYTAPTSKTTGKIFGLFGYVTGIVNISNLNLTVDADIPEGKACGGLISNVVAGSTLNISGVTVSGILYARNEKAAGFIGVANGNSTINMTNCSNKVNVTTKERAAGFISQIGNTDSVSFTNCHNEGKIELTKTNDVFDTTDYGVAAGFVSHKNGGTINYDDKSSNTGTIIAPLAANYHTHAGALKYTNHEWVALAGNTSSITIRENKGVIISESSEAYAKVAEAYLQAPNAFDGIYYNSENTYGVTFNHASLGSNSNGADSKYVTYDDLANYYTRNWNLGNTFTLQSNQTCSKTISVAGGGWTYKANLNGHTLTTTVEILTTINADDNHGLKIENGTIAIDSSSAITSLFGPTNSEYLVLTNVTIVNNTNHVVNVNGTSVEAGATVVIGATN